MFRATRPASPRPATSGATKAAHGTLRALALALIGVLAFAAPAAAITYGEPDGSGHPNVGAMTGLLPDGQRAICTGTLISPTVFLTAAHCIIAFERFLGVVPAVTFASTITDATPLLSGEAHADPVFDITRGVATAAHDIGVIVLDQPVAGITPATLPALGALEGLEPGGARLVAVGYGLHLQDRARGFVPSDWERRVAEGRLMSLTDSSLRISQNPALGEGGACGGDSGGPEFLAGSGVLAALTSWGDARCRSVNVGVRLDTPSARAFLGQYVTLP